MFSGAGALQRRARTWRQTRCSAKRSQRRLPTSNPLDDAVRICGPDKGSWAFVCLRQEAINRLLEIDDVAEDAAPEPLIGQLCEETFNRVDPGGRGRCEMKVKPRMLCEPDADICMLVSGIVVHDQMQVQIWRGLAVNPIEESDELLVSMAAHALANYLPVQHIECRKEGRRAVALVVVRHRLAPRGLHRKPALGAIECLDLRLLVHGEHQRMLRRVHVETNNVLHFSGELRVL